MTFLPRNILAETPADAVPLARASTKYMEGFQLLQPALGGTDIKTYANVRGNLDIYTVGTGQTIFRLRRGKGTGAPYEQTNLGISGRQLFTYTNDGAKSDTPNIMALGSNGQLQLAVFKSSTGTYYQHETKPAEATEAIRQFRGVRGLTGNIYFNVILDDGSTRPGILGNNFYKPGSDEWAGDQWVSVKDDKGAPVRAKTIAMAENNPVQSALFAISEADDLLFSETSDRTATMRPLGPRKVTHLSVVTDSNDKLNIFASERDTGKLLLKREKKYSTGGKTQFDDWVELDAGQDVKLTSLYAAQQFNGLLQVFAIGEDGDLHWTNQAPGARPSDEPVWQTLFNLGNQIEYDPANETSIFTVGRTESGYSEAYTVSRAGDVKRFWQSATTQQWIEETVELARTDDEMVRVEMHSLELSLLDDQGLPAANAMVSLKASALVTLYINGLSYRVSQSDEISVRAGSDGKIVIQQRANALAATTIYAETPFTMPGSPLVIQPNLQLQDKLIGLSVDDIKYAKDAEGQYLLPAKFRTDEHARSLQEITRASMSIAGADENGSGAINYHFARRSGAGFGFRPALNLSAMNGEAWEIDFTSGFPTYSATTSEEVSAWRAERLGAMKSAGTASLDGGFLGVDWGNVWNAVKNGAKWVVDGIKKIIVEVVDGIGRVLFHIGEKVFEAVIEFAQQAFDFIEGVWNWLKVKLDQLYQWLAFLFNIGDMVRTAEAIRHTMLVTLDFTIDGVESVKNMILSGIDTVKDELADVIDSFVEDLNAHGNPSIGQVSEENQISSESYEQLEHNPFSNAFMDNYEGADEKQNSAALRSSTALDSALDGLIEELASLADNFQFGDGEEAFSEALNYFTAIGDDPRNAMNLLLSGVAKIVESIAFFALDAAKGVIATIMDLIADVIAAFRDFLFNEWEIPILSQLYKFFTGKTLAIRPIDIAAYVMAVPTTLIYKMAKGKAPFPDQAALDTFTNYFTVDWLKSKVGLQTSALVKADISTDGWIKGISLAIYSAAMFARIPIDGATAALSSVGGLKAGGGTGSTGGTGAGSGTATPSKIPKILGLTSVVLRYITTVSSAPWLAAPGTPAPSCPAGSKGFSGVIWLCQLVFGPTRGLLITGFMPAGRPKIYTAEITVSLWGAANATMVIWNYVAQDSNARNWPALMRSLANIIPGQLCRFLFTPDIQKAYFIPAGVGGLLLVVGYLTSIAGAITDLADD